MKERAMLIRSSTGKRQHSGWLLSALLCLALLPLLLSACDDGTGTDTTGGSSSNGGTPCTSNCTPGKGAQSVQVFVEPNAGAQPVLSAIRGATKSVWVEVYLLTDSDVINALEDAANRGVQVRVLLELHPYGSGST